MLAQIKVYQQVETLEVATGLEGNNRYAVKNLAGQQFYFAEEGILYASYVRGKKCDPLPRTVSRNGKHSNVVCLHPNLFCFELLIKIKYSSFFSFTSMFCNSG